LGKHFLVSVFLDDLADEEAVLRPVGWEGEQVARHEHAEQRLAPSRRNIIPVRLRADQDRFFVVG
jgi:hypothetical protein